MNAPNNLWRDFRGYWGHWWPVALAPLWFLLAMIVIGKVRAEHYPIVLILTFLALHSNRSRDLLLACAPGIAALAAHEVVPWLRPYFVVEGRIWGCELQRLDATLFSFGTGLAPPDLLSPHHSPAADLFFALPYTLFWAVVVIYAVLLYFRDLPTMRRFLWLLALIHLAAMVLWLALPSAPPWYVRDHGCMINPEALPSAAGLAHLDERFGITYFAEFYSRAPTAFGALPSLHVAFPVAALFAAWSSTALPGRAVLLALSGWMVLASVYLDHHWLIDGMVSILLIAVFHVVLWTLWPRYRDRAH